MSKVMLVDDEAVITTQLEERLTAVGYEVVGTASSAEESIAKAEQLHPDVILMDIVMPGEKDGIDASHEIRAKMDIPIIFLTAYADDTFVSRAKSVEPFGYIVKPFQEDELRATIEVALYKKQIERKLQASEEKYRQLVEASQSGIFILADGRFEYMNKKSAEIFGYDAPELLGTYLEAVVVPEDREICRDVNSKVLKGEDLPSDLAFRVVTKDGKTILVQLLASVFSHGGTPALLGNVLDITERNRAEAQLTRSFVELAETVSQALDSRQPYAARHQRRVAEMARLVGEKMGLHEDELRGLYFGALLHDIGKVCTPDDILAKAVNLTKEEQALLRVHCKRGYEILKDVKLPWPVAEMALHHHERLDGSGYPDSISGDQLSLEVRILGVCNVVEAMSSHRPYRPARSKKEVLQELQNGRGTKYDADVVDMVLGTIESGELDSLLRSPE